ncbi:lysophospholipase L1-like esterase [Pseudomonas sp. GGS8]|uniref:SGNH/GDSL hydrolase family protein n=1 Tax=Pseudomonas sp. GGS8 TaxID=2817892 RepID=UPI00209CDBD3|nr:SGNH/GDSL hydrolase family protein [Pseudomonas sp. GGS8]MCP1442851.1 lysophospholipase L1-like esterase [Pseudomonas sp. GGS8]
MRRSQGLFTAWMFAVLIGYGCLPANGSTELTQQSDELTSPEEPQVAPALNLIKLVRKLKASHSTSVNIVQLGDSHTAADLFTGEMRRLFQEQYGEGGIGFIAAVPVSGTRYNQVVLSTISGQWSLISSRNQYSGEFPLGGYLSLPMTPGAQVHIDLRESNERKYRISALYRALSNSRLLVRDAESSFSVELLATSGQWRFGPESNPMSLPVDLTITRNQAVELGGWDIESLVDSGVTYSALGVNGATLAILDKWQDGWQRNLQALHPDLLVLAYGGNEAFDDGLDLALYKAGLNEKLALLRRILPDVVLLLIGPADSIKQRSANSCAGRQPENLAQIIQIQRQAALKAAALFWDWQAYMGGACSIERWQSEHLAQDDLIHLNGEGYRRSAGELYRYLQVQLMGK